ncbi:MAG: SUMF1/EgtB/PvdO family nonheme iron enzyme [Phycisphaerae bacterium]|nr:SUMF1/EgtB/PvdO family nonheme iron enzyme [Phycisphaerae bacterium]
MRRITQLHWVVVGLLIGTFSVCPVWGEAAGKPLSPQEAPQAVAGQPGVENSGVVLLSAVSRKSHGTAGEFDLDLGVGTNANVGLECRAGGPTQVVLTFSGPADGVDVQTSAGSVDAILVEGSQATVELGDVPNGICLVLGVSGVAGLESETWVRIRVLVGDVNGDGAVNIFDLVQVRNQLNQPVTASNFRADVNADGSINIFDLVTVRNNLNTAAVCLPPGMVLIPAGEFQMGDTFNEGSSNEQPVHAVWVDAFYMDRYEVTKELWNTERSWGLSSGYTDLIAGGGKGANHPVHSVNWFDCVKWANARSEAEGRTPCYYADAGLTTVYRTGELAPYVKWDANGYRLPTEAEWEKAARGGVSGQRFPHGNTINHDHANYRANGSAYTYDTSPYTTGTYHPTFAVGGMPYTSPVGYFAPNGYGLYDMAGNVWEWCNDWYGGTYYSSSPYNNPRGPATGSSRVLRGSSWYAGAYICRAANRNNYSPGTRFTTLGVRVVCSVGGVD